MVTHVLFLHAIIPTGDLRPPTTQGNEPLAANRPRQPKQMTLREPKVRFVGRFVGSPSMTSAPMFSIIHNGHPLIALLGFELRKNMSPDATTRVLSPTCDSQAS